LYLLRSLLLVSANVVSVYKTIGNFPISIASHHYNLLQHSPNNPVNQVTPTIIYNTGGYKCHYLPLHKIEEFEEFHFFARRENIISMSI